MTQQSTYPATSILVNSKGSLENRQPSQEELLFYYRIILRSIDAYLNHRYTEFDAHTTSNCCHGIAILVYELIQSLQSYDLLALQQEGLQKIQELEKSESVQETSIWQIPAPLLELSRLYLLTFVREIKSQSGGRTVPKKLQIIGNIGSNFCFKIVHNLQKHLSNKVALRYDLIANSLDKYFIINGESIEIWRKYLQPHFLRSDLKNLLYAPCLFSMQISLAHIIASKMKVAILNDLRDSNGYLKGRYIRILESNGLDLKPITAEVFTLQNNEEPILIFSGCSISDESDLDDIQLQMDSWSNRFPSLVLACDASYPQFPKVKDDPSFDNSPITPDEDSLRDLIQLHSQIEGTSIADPSLFCLHHIYLASSLQIHQLINNESEMSLPLAFIPTNTTENTLVSAPS